MHRRFPERRFASSDWRPALTVAANAFTGPAHQPGAVASQTGIWIVVEIADDGGHAGLCLNQMVAAVTIAAEPPALPQLIQFAGDLTAIVTAERLDQIRIKHWRRGERLL